MALLVAFAGTALAQTASVDLIGIGTNATDQFYFECSGSPTCSGQFVAIEQKSGCSNATAIAGAIRISVPDVSVAGPVSGSGTLTGTGYDWQHNADGTCTPVASGALNASITFGGSSDGVVASVTYTVTDSDGTVRTVSGTLVRASAAYSSAQVSGSVSGTSGDGGAVAITFTCVGAPFCTGTYSGSIRDSGCSNAFALSGAVTFTGFDLASGTLGGTVVLQNANTHDQPNADGTCSIKSTTDQSVAYSGTFNGSGGTLAFTGTTDNGIPFSIPGTFSATGIGGTPPSSTPPFQIQVNSQINATSATASATILPPAADVGKTVSVYVFAFAPRSLVKSASRLAMKDDVSGCELAQYDPATGQLRAASASNLSPALTATLGAQGQSVTILNNASTPSIAGATFFVGYGANASTMISNGGNVNAVQIPGAQQCPTVFPQTPADLSGLWWGGPAENGWGIDFTERSDKIFAAFYTYDGAGNPKWYVSPLCQLPSPGVASGRCSGDLYEVDGSTPLFGIAAAGAEGGPSKAGSLQLDFIDSSHATMSFTVGSVSRTVPIMRQLTRSAPSIDYTDLWYAGQQSQGWGMAISQQADVMFLAWFVYDASGKPVWYVAPDCAVVTSGNGCAGDLFQVTGAPFGPTFDPTKIQASKIGTVAMTFSDPNNGTMNYTVNGTTGSKTIMRQVF